MVGYRATTAQEFEGLTAFVFRLKATSTLMTEAASSSETLVTTYHTTRCHNTEDQTVTVSTSMKTSNLTSPQSSFCIPEQDCKIYKY